MKKRLTAVMIILIIIFIYVVFRNNHINFYVSPYIRDSDELQIEVFIDGEQVFKGRQINNYFNLKHIPLKKSFGFHEVLVTTSDGDSFTESFFIIYNQSVILEFFSPCEDKRRCISLRNQLQKFRPD